jgi:hypothetical protein
MRLKLVAYHVLTVKNKSNNSTSIEGIQKYWSLNGYGVDYKLFGISSKTIFIFHDILKFMWHKCK